MASSPVVLPLAKWIAEIDPELASVRHFRSGRIDRFGRVVGVVEVKGDKLPAEHQTHHLDSMGRCLRLEKFGEGTQKPINIRLYRYDGFQVAESLWLNEEGVVWNYHRYTYDTATGLLTWRGEYNWDGKLFYAITSAYSGDGLLESETWTDGDGKRVKQLSYRYDKKGEIVAEARTDENGNAVGTLEIAYDKQGRVSDRIWKGPDGKRRSRMHFLYDSQGRISRIESFGALDRLTLRQENTYDAVGNIVAERWMDAQGKVFREKKAGAGLEGSPGK